MKKSIILFVVFFLSAGLFAQDGWARISNPEMGYTIPLPAQAWKMGRVFYNPKASEEVILEKSLAWNENGGYITIDAWKTSIDGDIYLWTRVIGHTLGIEPQLFEKALATEMNLEAVSYRFMGDKQSFNTSMIFFKHDDKVFRISYLERDSGASRAIYEYIVKNFAFNEVGNPLGELKMEASRVYSCGGQNDTCQCNMNNPYPCCDNDSNCTWWAWHKACCVWGIGLPSPWRNAKYWATDLSSNGFPVRSTPAVNTIGCSTSGTYGHVVWVVEVSGSKVRVTEMNCCSGCPAGVREKWYEASYFTGGFIYKK